MIKMHNTPPWVDSIRQNFDYIADHIMPAVSADDNGKVMAVVNGEWEATDIGAGVTEVTVATDGAVTQALDPGKLYHFTGTLTALTITFNAASGQPAHYHFDFLSGSGPATLTIPVSVQMPDSFSVEAGKRYEVDVLNNFGAVLSWTIS